MVTPRSNKTCENLVARTGSEAGHLFFEPPSRSSEADLEQAPKLHHHLEVTKTAYLFVTLNGSDFKLCKLGMSPF